MKSTMYIMKLVDTLILLGISTALTCTIAGPAHAEEAYTDLDIVIENDGFRWVTGTPFSDAIFTVMNATGAVRVSAQVLYPNRVWRPVQVQDCASGVTGDGVDIRGSGRIIWDVLNAGPDYYSCRLQVWYVGGATNRPALETWFTIELIEPGLDADGDSFCVFYKHDGVTRAFAEPVIHITGGSDSDTLVMKVVKSELGDGCVDLDTITSDRGFKKIDLKGSAAIMRLNGPLGSLKITGGILGELSVSNGGIGTVLIKNKWLPEYEDFAAQVGIAYRVYADGDIGTIAVHGGSVGMMDEPAVICSGNGNIGTVTAKVMKKKVGSSWEAYTVIADEDGAGVYGQVLAPNGSIGSVTSYGGCVGAPYDYSISGIAAAQGVRKVAAKAIICDGMPVGGCVYASVESGTAIGAVIARGGDVSLGEIFDLEDLAEFDLPAVTLRAPVVGTVKATAMLVSDGVSLTPYGGSVKADVFAQRCIGAVSARGGDACMQLHVSDAGGSIGSVAVRGISYKEYRDDLMTTRRGGSIVASVIATTAADDFQSRNAADYCGPIKSLRADGFVRDTWIGYQSSASADTLDYLAFKCGGYERTEIWEAKGVDMHIVTY